MCDIMVIVTQLQIIKEPPTSFSKQRKDSRDLNVQPTAHSFLHDCTIHTYDNTFRRSNSTDAIIRAVLYGHYMCSGVGDIVPQKNCQRFPMKTRWRETGSFFLLIDGAEGRYDMQIREKNTTYLLHIHRRPPAPPEICWSTLLCYICIVTYHTQGNGRWWSRRNHWTHA